MMKKVLDITVTSTKSFVIDFICGGFEMLGYGIYKSTSHCKVYPVALANAVTQSCRRGRSDSNQQGLLESNVSGNQGYASIV